MKKRIDCGVILFTAVVVLTFVFGGCASPDDDDDDPPSYCMKTRRNYDADGTYLSAVNYRYDDEGKFTENSLTNAEGAANGTDKFEFGSPHDLTKILAYGADGELSVYWIYTYDDSGNIAKKEMYRADADSLSITITMTYDSGRKTREEYSENYGSARYTIFTYKADGTRERADTYNGSGELLRAAIFSYADGRCSKVDLVDAAGALTMYHEFDWEEGKAVSELDLMY